MAQDDIQGQVVDPSGNPVSGAIVELTRSYESNPDARGNVFRTTTDSNGNYIFEGHPDGDGTTQEWHVSAYNHDGTAYVNSFNNPGVTADLSPAIPDSGDLHARYSAKDLSLTDGDAVSTFSDETGNGFDLTQSTGSSQPTFNSSVINGNPVVRFDGSDDFMDVAFSAVSQATHIFVVAQYQTIDSPTEPIYDSDASGNRHLMGNSGGTDYQMFAGSVLNGETPDTSPHIWSSLFNGANSVNRLDGSQIASGDAGTDSLDGFTLGSIYDGTQNAPVDVGEILIYPQDKSGIQSDVEQYLSDEWGITI